MGFLGDAWEVFQDVTSLGGTNRLRNETKRHARLSDEYQQLQWDIPQKISEREVAFRQLQKEIRRSFRPLRSASRILIPRGKEVEHSTRSPRVQIDSNPSESLGLSRTRLENLQHLSHWVPTLGGGAIGTASALGLWNITQVAAHASTGTAMLGLHGVAASNAGWAWYGGGSLATGGGGMLAGHFVLPGIGTAIAVGASAFIAHSAANKIAEQCNELEEVNRQNRVILYDLYSNLGDLRRAEEKFRSENVLLNTALKSTRRKLFRFGWLSHLYRLVRSWLGGDYYQSKDLPYVEPLDSAVAQFYSAFREA